MCMWVFPQGSPRVSWWKAVDGIKKRQIVSEPPVVRKVGIRPFNVGQAHLVLGSVACASTCHSSLNGRFPTFRFLRVGRCTSGVYFFQGVAKPIRKHWGACSHVLAGSPDSKQHDLRWPTTSPGNEGVRVCAKWNTTRNSRKSVVCDLAFISSIAGCHSWRIDSRVRHVASLTRPRLPRFNEP